MYTLTVTDINHCVIMGTASTTVNPLPLPFTVSGDGNYCAGTAGVDITLGGSQPGVNYQLYSGASIVGSPLTGSGGPLDFGNHVAGIYTVSGVYSVSGCSTPMSGSATISAIPPPSGITGTLTVCAGLTTNLTDATAGGTWSIAGGTVAAVGSSGIVSGIAGGTAVVSYTAGTGCAATAVVTVYPLGPITGNANICAGSIETLGDIAAGGTWTSSNPGVATINSVTGFLNAVTAGNTTITYSLSTGCTATMPLTVNPLPATISGSVNICPLSSATLSDATPGGTWSTNSALIATVGTTTGVVSGVASGTTLITYTLPTGCIATIPATVLTPPSAILQFSGLCLGYATTLSDATTGGTWSSSAPATASVGTAGVVSGNALGTATITYQAPGTGCIAVHVVTVQPLPLPITGPLTVCTGPTVTLSDASPGGLWTCSTPSVATVSPFTGVVTGVTEGIAMVTYTISTGCIQTVRVTVNPMPSAILGATRLCVGANSSLSDVVDATGTWSSSLPGIASVGSASGIVTGITAGTTIITFTLATGCYVTQQVTVNPLPAPVSGNVPVCTGATISLASFPAGGTWISSNVAVASIGTLSGIVSGVSAGTALVSYTISTGCSITAAVTVNPIPAPVTGSSSVCIGLTTSFSDATAGGTWSSSFPFVATVGGTGIVSGNATGTATITYTLPTGCIASAPIAVYPPPSPITGVLTVCVGGTTNLSDGGGGTWSSGTSGVASVAAGAGVVTGNAAGTAVITYALPTGCTTTAIITVNPLPAAILGNATFCAGSSTTLSDLTLSGTWSSGNTIVATIGSTSGFVAGLSGGTSAITYRLNTGCLTTTIVTVQSLPAAITGVTHVCAGLTTTLSDATAGGAWSVGASSVAGVDGFGVVSGIAAGTTNVTYTVAGGCSAVTVVTVNPLPALISGATSVCAGLTTMLSDATTGGTWHSSNTAVAAIGASGLVAALSAGTASISYTLPTGCLTAVTLTVNSLPTAILGSLHLCAGTSEALSDGSAGGSWSVSPAAAGVASVVAPTGFVSAISAGTAVITYTLPTGCITTSVLTVDPLPLSITGASGLCVGATTALTDASAGGTWSSGDVTLATVVPATGIVNGVAEGTVVITYKLATGCFTTTTFTVNPLPLPISGRRSVCLGAASVLSDASVGGTWASSPATIDSIGLISGIITARAFGTATVTFTLPTACRTTTVITVNPLPTAILGSATVCQGAHIMLSDTTVGGEWGSADTTVAMVSAVGVVTGVTAGTVSVSYTLATGCGVAAVVTVNPVFPISGSQDICLGVTSVLSDLAAGGTWSSGTPSVATVGSTTGAVTGMASGATYISYHLGTGCTAILAVTVNHLPASYDVTGGGAYCFGGTGVNIGLNGSDSGVYYEVIYMSGIIGGHAGTDSALEFGSFTLGGIYKVRATNAVTGCANIMADSATITVNPIVAPSVSIDATVGTIICAGALADFLAVPVNGGSSPFYQWSVNGINTGTGPGFGYIPASGDIVAVKLISDAACAVPDSATNFVTITTVAGVLPSVSISVSPGDSLCPGTPVTIYPSPVNGGTSPVYDWIVNGAFSGSGATYTYLPVDGDNIFCRMHSSAACALINPVNSDNNINMNVPPILIPVVAIAAYPGNRIQAGDTVMLVANVAFSGSVVQYQWELNGVNIVGATSDTFISSTFNNRDSVSCVVTGMSTCGAASRAADVIIIDTVALGVQALNTIAGLVLLPNPNNGSFLVRGSAANADNLILTITDMLGQVVYKSKVTPRKGRINEQVDLGQSIANGLYLLELRSGTINEVVHFVVGR